MTGPRAETVQARQQGGLDCDVALLLIVDRGTYIARSPLGNSQDMAGPVG
jgi:hypothetical protein